MQPKLSAAMRAKLAARNLELHAYQPISMFKTPRKLASVAEPGDPWVVTLYRKGMCSWEDGARAGQGQGDALEDAIERALGGGDLLGAISRLGAVLDGLTAVLRA